MRVQWVGGCSSAQPLVEATIWAHAPLFCHLCGSYCLVLNNANQGGVQGATAQSNAEVHCRPEQWRSDSAPANYHIVRRITAIEAQALYTSFGTCSYTHLLLSDVALDVSLVPRPRFYLTTMEKNEARLQDKIWLEAWERSYIVNWPQRMLFDCISYSVCHCDTDFSV